jgi:hypothetical protein
MTSLFARTNTVLLVLLLLATFAIIGMLATGVRGGPLDPPGPPGSTASVRLPGTPISGPTTISQPGHYYLTNNITVTGSQNAITISSQDVTLDLGGFHIKGGGGLNSVGIGTGPFIGNVEIRNGSVSNFYIGVDIRSALASRLSGMRVYDTTARGIVLGSGSVLDGCIVYGNSGEGAVVEGQGSIIRGCTIYSNSLNGVFLIGAANVVTGSHFLLNSNGATTADVRVLGDSNIVGTNHFSGSVNRNAMYVTGADTTVAENVGNCDNFRVKDSTGSTLYSNNACITIVP